MKRFSAQIELQEPNLLANQEDAVTFLLFMVVV
jgi:hypothetical protein